MKMNMWLILKVVLILIGVGLALFQGALPSRANPTITLDFLIVPILFGIIGLQFVIGIQAHNKKSTKQLIKPSWQCNPFNFSQPLYFFHFGGWFMLLSTLPTVFFTYFQSPDYIYDSLMPVSTGRGYYGGRESFRASI